MHSLLKVELKSDIDVHYQSFLDFLLDPSRSGEYHTFSGRRQFDDLLLESDHGLESDRQADLSLSFGRFPFGRVV